MNECEDDCGYAAFFQQQLEQRRLEEEQDLLKADPAYQRFLAQQNEQSLSYRIKLETEHGPR